MSVNKKRTGVGIGVALVQWLSDDRNSLSVSDVRKNLVEFNCFYCRDADDDDVTIFENSQLQRSSGNFTYVYIFSYLLDRPFCSVECRSKQIFKDEEETTKAKQNQTNSIASSSLKNSRS
ncbi:uncharacterized protein LOC107853686 isoform X7 [Capsicum annuum]|uniref:uncharacterized protein LOC107853686 isoform X7 n=1 Tax=Capsicum annuum TaxID=4072 RepID=UPI001FB13AD8|nr:uncharacterized protein LOC107853686 isoform X7 [Capsicum annuum]